LEARPLGFLGAAAFQWVNPKAWVMAVSGLTAYAVSPSYLVTVAAVAGAYGVVGLPCAGFWVGFGASMRRFLENPRVLSAFNLAMALLLVASIIPTFLEG
jgi:threonine/homoserine/homoserine lactone efflux protein